MSQSDFRSWTRTLKLVFFFCRTLNFCLFCLFVCLFVASKLYSSLVSQLVCDKSQAPKHPTNFSPVKPGNRHQLCRTCRTHLYLRQGFVHFKPQILQPNSFRCNFKYHVGHTTCMQCSAIKVILQTNKQKFKVRQPQRAARSKRPNTPSDGSKNNGIHTTKQEEYPSRHPTTDTANKSPAGD